MALRRDDEVETSVHMTISNRRSIGSAQLEFMFFAMIGFIGRGIMITFYFYSNLQAIFEGMAVIFCRVHFAHA